MRKAFASIALTAALMFGGAAAAQAACWYGPPTSGYQVNYSNCTMVGFNYYLNKPIYRCWADYDSWAEWFRGEVDRWVTVYGYRYCSA